MRGFTKVAALLSSASASAFVIPDSFGLRPSGGVLNYKASLRFTIDELEATTQPPIFEFQISGTNKACGESDVQLNGQRLESEWDGVKAYGWGYLDILGGREASWTVTCLYDATPSDGSFSTGDDVIHFLRLHFEQSGEGFMLSYKQKGKPAILRFDPKVLSDDPVKDIASKWRQPSIYFDQDISTNSLETDKRIKSFWHRSQSLLSIVSAFQSRLKNNLVDSVKKLNLCYKNKVKHTQAKPFPLALVPLSPNINETRSLSEAPEGQGVLPETSGTSQTSQTLQYSKGDENIEDFQHKSTITLASIGSTSTKSYLSATQTRSIQTSEDISYLASAANLSPSTSTPHENPNHRPLKIFGLALIILSLLLWCLVRWKDPRWRVDRAARREERRNKCLYKNAARKHRIKTWFWNVRMKFRLVNNDVLNWDEKRARVVSQEEILENVMKSDIRALRNAHGVISSVTAAEEGRNQFEYEAESSERRRSVSTLPGYESEGSQPPSYEASGSFQGTTLVGSYIFTPADVDSNPDSSVVSTSPRISRDGSSSEFDEKIEALSLDHDGASRSSTTYSLV